MVYAGSPMPAASITNVTDNSINRSTVSSQQNSSSYSLVVFGML